MILGTDMDILSYVTFGLALVSDDCNEVKWSECDGNQWNVPWSDHKNMSIFIYTAVFWVITLCGLAGCYQRLRKNALRPNGIIKQERTV